MFSRGIRCYATPKAASQLWVKHSDSPSTQVSLKSCINIDDFAENVKQKLNINCQVALFTALEKKAIRPGLKVKELMKTKFKDNSDENPLLIKIIPATHDFVKSKTIFIRDTDDDDRKFTDEYVEYSIKNNENLRDICKNGKGLIQLSDRKKVIVDFDDIEHGKEYQVYKYAQDFAGWRKKEADAMEAET